MVRSVLKRPSSGRFAANNLTGDGTISYGFDALGRLTGTTTRYTQDLAGKVSRVLATTSGGAAINQRRLRQGAKSGLKTAPRRSMRLPGLKPGASTVGSIFDAKLSDAGT
jgi:hypothetical protein